MKHKHQMDLIKKALLLALAAAMVFTFSSCSMQTGTAPAASSAPAAQGDASSAQAVASESPSADAPAAAGDNLTESEFVYDPANPYPTVAIYREGDPDANPDAEITSTNDITWTVACMLQESNPQAVALKKIAEELSQKTDGHFQWDVFYNSTLGSESECVELCRNNTVQLVTSNVTVMSTYVEDFGVFALPYLFHSEEDELQYLTTSPVAYKMYEELENTAGLVTLGFNCTGARALSTKGVDQIKTPDDLKKAGVKVRSMEAQVWQDVINSLGATPVPVAYTELYTALQTGVVQGQDNPVANTVDGKFFEVIDKFYNTDHSYLVSAYYTNPTAWDQLPADYKSLLLGLIQKYLGNYYHEEILKFREECAKTIADAGVAVIGQDQLDMDAFYKNADAMVQEKYMSNPKYADVVNDVKKTFNY